MTIGVGLIGFGLGGSVFHAPFVAAMGGLELRAVVSSRPTSVQDRYPATHVVSTVEALLAEPGIDLIIVSSPDALHAEHAIAALQAGKHVVVDKPFASSLAEANQIAAVAHQAGRMLTVFHNRRWDADFLTLQRIIREGKLGRIVHFESHFDRWRPVTPDLWKEARPRGSWFDLGPHLVDQAIVLFGPPTAVTADIATMRSDANSPDWFHVMLHYPHHRAVLHSSKLSASNTLRFAVHGTGGSWIKQGLDAQEAALTAGALPNDVGFGMDPHQGVYTPSEDPTRSEQVENEPGSYSSFWSELERALSGNGPTPVLVSDALEVMRVLEVGWESATSRKTVELSQDNT